jgi:hypothetical protein
MRAYSPFDKDFKDLQPADLLQLKQASEGWYIEYKREVPNALAIAKSISALANTYGGWLFLGVAEESKENSVAGEFPGIARSELDGVLQRIRKSVADLLSPAAHYEVSSLLGPVDAIGLAEDRAVICVSVPRSMSAPHIHKSGVIYRRVADASEPRPENDRFVLDQLWRRSDELRKQYRDWHESDPEFSDQERHMPYIRLMFIADKWNDRDVWIGSDDQAVRDAMSATKGIVGAMPFDTVHTSADGYVGRQLIGNDVQNLTITWRLRRNLTSDIYIPLTLYQCSSIEELRLQLNGYQYAGQYIQMLSKHRTSALRVVDLNFLFSAMIGVIEVQRRLCSLAGWTEPYHYKARLLNAWRTTPFVDVESIIDGFQKFGPPINLDSKTSSPRGTDPESFFQISDFAELTLEEARIYVQATMLFYPVALAFGIPGLDSFEDASKPPYFERLVDAGRRAAAVQQRRNQDLNQKA